MKCLIALLIALAAQAAWALNCSSLSGGNWNTASIWSCNAVPGASDDVTINNAHNVSLNGANRSARSLTVNTGGTLTTGSNNITIAAGTGVLVVDGNIAGNGNAASRVIKSSTGNLSGSGTITNVNDVTVNGATTIAAGADLTFTGAECRLDALANITNDGTLTFNTAACGTSRIINVGNPVTFTNNGNVTTGTVLGANATGSVWTNAADSILEVRATLLATGILNAAATNNLVRYNVNAAQAVKLPAGGNYFHLQASGGNTKTPAAGTYNILGDFTIDAGVTFNANANDPTINVTGAMGVAGTYNSSNTAALSVTGGLTVTGTYTGNGGALNLSGDFTNNGTFTSGIGIVSFIGGAAQAFGGTSATTITALRINKTAATDLVTMAAATPSPTVTLALILTSGRLVTAGGSCAAAVPIILGTVAVAAVGSTTSYVQGALRKNFAVGASLNFLAAGQDEFPVGTAAAYSPIEISAGTTSTAGNIVVCVTPTDDPSMTVANGGGIDTAKSVNRYWSMATTTINTAPAPMDATFKFVAADVDTGANTANFIVQRYDGADWNPTTLVAAGATSTRASGINISSAVNEFQIGEPLATFPPVLGAFNAFDTSAPAGAIISVIRTKQAGTSFDVRLVRIANNAIDTAYNQSGVTVELYNASNNTGALSNGCRSSWSAIAGTSRTVTFASGVVTVTFAAAQVPNVFRDVRVHVVKGGAGAGEGCSTDRFAIRPTGLVAGALDLDWQQPYVGVGASRNLTNTSAQGGVVHAASESGAATPRPFTLTTVPQAAGGQSASNYDGTPTVVAGFPTCIAPPTSCTTGTLSFTGGSWTGTGTRTNATAHYSEAGVFNLQMQDTTYASVDALDGSTSAERTVPATGTSSIGRFVPDRFLFSAPTTPQLQTFGSACASRSFTYVGQPFWYATLPSATLQAVNANGAVTTNYKGFGDGSNGSDLFHLTASGFTETYSNNTVGPTLNIGSAVSPPQLSGVGDGTATYTARAAAADVNLAYARDPATPVAPFNANISLNVTATDASEAGVSGNPGNGAPSLTTTSALVFDGGGSAIAFDAGSGFRYGVVRLLDVFAPLAGNASGNAPVAIQAQYWNGTALAANTADHCSSFTEKNFVLHTHGGSITAANLPTPTAGSNGKVSMGVATFASGVGRVNVVGTGSPPPPITTITQPGSVRICLDLDSSLAQIDGACVAVTPANKPYLHGRWTGTSYEKDPDARVGFGLYGAQPKNFIFFRENY